jgi:hypothetical protein
MKRGDYSGFGAKARRNGLRSDAQSLGVDVAEDGVESIPQDSIN